MILTRPLPRPRCLSVLLRPSSTSDNTLEWKVLPGVFLLWGLLLLGCGLSLAASGR